MHTQQRTKTVSLITTVCRNLTDLKNFWESLLATSEKDFEELILVSNGSPNEVVTYIREVMQKDPRVLIIFNDKNYGLGHSTDQGAHIAVGDYIFRTDTDVVFKTKNWILKMIAVAEKDPSIGSVATVGNSGRRTIQHMDFLETDTIIGWCQCIPKRTIQKIEKYLSDNRQTLLNRASLQLKEWQEKIVKEQVSLFGNDGGKSLLYRDSVKQAIIPIEKCKDISLALNWVMVGEGYWDPNYFYGADDFDYSLLQRFVGLKLAVCTDVDVEHRNASMDENWKLFRHWNVWNGFNYFRMKWELLLGESIKGDLTESIPTNEEYVRRYEAAKAKQIYV